MQGRYPLLKTVEGLRDLLNRPPTVPLTITHTHTEDTDEYNGSRARTGGSANEVNEPAALYRDEYRELARKTGSEPEYRTYLYDDVVHRLGRGPLWTAQSSS
ncbi:hypothetical protein BU25DRAFT_458258 [Macroventuria anomochaeta]|uniref:Uncharacterized protein n=1 Tax=Macroventuria anomochaeta TaxID=301207 RepID=A0ACB6S1E8_9PLEO|nr:uncharacterized protein BU25DRAFT_458258 [Macroventuria anomochaeta]KAF2627859.1 hypothetical protein BU25DRAFT_458258 [Macroventuria anomochaeta]